MAVDLGDKLLPPLFLEGELALPLPIFGALGLDDAARNFLQLCMSDIRVLLPLALAVWAFVRRQPLALGLGLGLGLAVKPIPAVLYFPLLLAVRSPAAVCVCAGTVALLFGPFVLWDASGVLWNLVLWGAVRGTDSSSWIDETGPIVTTGVRVVIAALALVLVARLTRRPFDRGPSLFCDLVLLHVLVLLASGMFHNNYVPWFTFLLSAELAAALFPGFPRDALSSGGVTPRNGAALASPPRSEWPKIPG